MEGCLSSDDEALPDNTWNCDVCGGANDLDAGIMCQHTRFIAELTDKAMEAALDRIDCSVIEKRLYGTPGTIDDGRGVV